MAVRDYWTAAEARDQLSLWKAAMKALATGQVSEYVIGSRRLTMLDSKEIQERIEYFGRVLKELATGANARASRRVVPRDL